MRDNASATMLSMPLTCTYIGPYSSNNNCHRSCDAIVGEVAVHDVLMIDVHDELLAQQDISKFLKCLYNQ
jgi:hypothetical protein